MPESTQAQITSSQSKTTRNRPNQDKTKLLIRKRTRKKGTNRKDKNNEQAAVPITAQSP